MSFHPWILHEIYVDETQDFTQAELALLVSLCSEPNKMFLTGDTAQSIMRGISFRFHDLRSLFFYTKKSANKKEGHLSSLKVSLYYSSFQPFCLNSEQNYNMFYKWVIIMCLQKLGYCRDMELSLGMNAVQWSPAYISTWGHTLVLFFPVNVM